MFRVLSNHESLSTFRELLADALLSFIAVLLAAATISESPSGNAVAVLTMPMVLMPAFAFAVMMSLLYSFLGLYRQSDLGVVSIAWRLAFAFLVGGYITYLAMKELPYEGHPSRLVGYALLYVFVGLVAGRGMAWLTRRAVGAKRVLIVGTGEDAVIVMKGLAGTAASRRQRELIGFYPTCDGADVVGAGARVFDRSQSLRDVVCQHRVKEIIVAAREHRGGGVPMDELLACRIRGIPIVDLAAFYERTQSEVPLDSLKASWLVYGQGFVQGRLRRAVKRSFDIASSAALLLVSAPVMVLTAIAIRIDSPGPIIYRQERVGLGGRSFTCLKFRSMRADAEQDGVARWAAKRDARVTRVGSWIRKTRVDELPQLFSVLRGEMSMVGPRPERPSFVAELREQIPFYDVRHTIKPGVTGWAQVRYSYGASLEEARRKHQFDLYYVKNNSVWLDILVLIETVTVVLFREGAQ